MTTHDARSGFTPHARRRPMRGVALAGLATALFLISLDTTMVNIAGVAIREGLGLTAAELTVVVNSYLVAFAGLLLLGGRLGDVLGGREVFLAGTAVFLAASVVCALATNIEMLVAGRIGQGVGAAAALPAALSLVLALYPTPAERTRALGIWGAVAGAASLIGVFLGGVLTDVLGWSSVFLVPVPFGIIGAIIVWRSVPSVPGTPGQFDVLGAITITAGISGLALGMVSAAEAGFTAPIAVISLVAGLASLAAFVIVEWRADHPLVPLGVFRRKPVVTGNLVMLLVGGTLASLFFFLPQYQQGVLGMSALAVGLTQVPIAFMIIVGAGAAPLLTKGIGLPRALPVGLTVLLAGSLWLTLDQTTSGFSVSLAIAFVLIGTGIGLSLVNSTAMAVRDSADGESGLLSGLVNAAQQLGAAVVLAALAGIAIGAAGAGGDISFTTAFIGQAALILIALALSAIPTLTTRQANDAAGTHRPPPRKETPTR